jgi:hypothetical protein
MSETLTIKEIEDRYKSEWILVENPESDESGRVVRGNVLFHSPDRDAMYRKSVELRPTDFAFLFTGTIPEGTAVVL